MSGEVRFEPIVALTHAPTADENHAIGSGLARFTEQQSGLRGGRPLAVIVRDPQAKQPIGPDPRHRSMPDAGAQPHLHDEAPDVGSTALPHRGDAALGTRGWLLRGAFGLAVFLGACATTNTPQQDLAYARWAKCNAPYVQLQWIDLDGRITFRYSTEGGRQDVLRCLADAGRTGPPLPDAVGMRPPSGP